MKKEKNKYLHQLDRRAITIGTLKQNPLEETLYWLSKTAAERLMALELLRMRMTGYDNAASRLQRTITIMERP